MNGWKVVATYLQVKQDTVCLNSPVKMSEIGFSSFTGLFVKLLDIAKERCMDSIRYLHNAPFLKLVKGRQINQEVA